jgi:hypothetical protein
MRAPLRNVSTGGPGTLLVTKSTPFSIEPKSAVYTGVGNRRSMPDTSSSSPSAGSARWRATSSRMARSRVAGSAIPTGTISRAGTNGSGAVPLAASRTLIAWSCGASPRERDGARGSGGGARDGGDEGIVQRAPTRLPAALSAGSEM